MFAHDVSVILTLSLLKTEYSNSTKRFVLASSASTLADPYRYFIGFNVIMTESNKKRVGKGGIYIYVESVISAITGYGLWLLLTKITTAAVVGTTSTVITLASIFTTIVAIGIPNSVPRFLGKSFSEQHLENAKVFVKASLFLVSIGITVGT